MWFLLMDYTKARKMNQFEFQGQQYTIEINYWESTKVLPEYGIFLGTMFTDEEAAAKTMQNLGLDDEAALRLAWKYVEPTTSMSEETFYKTMNGEQLDKFREAFWAAVVNFSGALKKNLLVELWSEFKKELKKASKNPTLDK